MESTREQEVQIMNKVERVKAVLNGQTPDKVPAGFWFHYPASFTVEETVKGHLDLFRHTDMDIMKIMQDFMYPIHSQINSASDWYNLTAQIPRNSKNRLRSSSGFWMASVEKPWRCRRCLAPLRLHPLLLAMIC